MRVPPPQPAASRCRRSCDRHGSGSRSASATPVIRVWKMKQCTSASSRAQRAREAQVEEAVLAHRAADVEQQHEARAHAAAVLPGQPERRAAACHAAPYRALQVEPAAVMRSALRGAAAGASGAGRSGASAPRCRAPDRRDRGRGNRWTRATPRGSRHAARRGRRPRSAPSPAAAIGSCRSAVAAPLRRVRAAPVVATRLSANAFLFGGRK